MHAIKTKNITKVYEKNVVLDNITLDVPKGSVFGFLGPNGAGKTTLIRIICGTLNPTKGEAYIFGGDIRNTETKMKIGYLPESVGFYGNMSALFHLDFYGKLFGLGKRERAKRAENLLKTMGVWEYKNQKTGTFSHGMKQRLGIAQALLNNPSLLVLDEPTTGLDPLGAHEVRMLVKKLVEGEEVTVFMASHNLAEVQMICDYVGIVDRGKLLAVDSIKNLHRKFKDSGLLNAVIVEIQNFNENMINTIEKISGVEFVSMVEKEGRHAKMKIVLSSQELNIQGEISKSIHTKGGIILSMFRKEPSLEELFLKLTK